MKLSNIWKGWLTTLLGVLITVLTALATQLSTGELDWKAISAVALPALVLALTDLLKQTKATIEKPKPRAYKTNKKP